MPITPRGLVAARLTPVGRGAVATIRLSGLREAGSSLERGHPSQLNPLFQAANGIALCEQLIGKIAFGQWGLSGTEDLVICRESEDAVEIHCHGGDAAVQRIFTDLSTAGCSIVDWREQVALERDLIEAECLDILSRTTTWRTTKFALEQAGGLLKSAFTDLYEYRSSAEETYKAKIAALLQWADFGRHLSTPWSVVLTGRPNVGKSSLINALLGYERAIVFDEPGTTRDVVTGDTAFDGWPVVLADTAGIRSNAGDLESAGIALARERLQSADVRIVLIDISQQPTHADQDLIAEYPHGLLVAHKSDLVDCWGHQLPLQAIRVSSVTGEGLIELQHHLVDRLVPQIPKPGTPIPITDRQIGELKELRTSKSVEDRKRTFERLFGFAAETLEND